jgi:methylenetetrahydrofolate--tRNA-(uracil-5-)-methyltransferase
MIPALRSAEYLRDGVMHRNTFINSSKLLDETLCLKKQNNLYFAGQLTGCEGYVCAIATGAMTGINIRRRLLGEAPFILDDRSAIGGILRYITTDNDKLQPMGPNFGVIRELSEKIRDKNQRYQKIAEISLNYLREILQKTEGT